MFPPMITSFREKCDVDYDAFVRNIEQRLNRADVLCSYQDVYLSKEMLEVFFKFFEKLFGLSIIRGDDFNFDDVIDVLYAAIFPSSLIRSR